MLTVTKDLVLPTTITGSYPKPNWYTQNLQTRAFKVAMGDSLFREQYLDAVAGILTEQSMAGLDILTDGDARFDLAVGASPGSSTHSSGWAASKGGETCRPAGRATSPLAPGTFFGRSRRPTSRPS